ncbi:pyruvate kinase [Fimbriiglobus ruber]|uniref:Pyruvate kinase n=1 Tax=Fimbriiglobus ruber TaxID=1908690 RepID=A0A225D4C7_9BACT|nr:pyruvate kinase [Fimbriiglobus ruber]OWK36440.1 Pyruvate kinase [Fimbriiglobus ruber]
MSRRTKIVATLGPATDHPAALAGVITAGLDVARINFSHGSEAEHLGRIARLRETADRLGRAVAILADLPGPKLRVKIPVARTLTAGETILFPLLGCPVGEADIAITEPEVLSDLRPGDRMLLDDGRLRLKALGTSGGKLKAEVVIGGELLPNKGLNLPDSPLSIPAVTDRDRAALAVAAKAGVDWLALSFVRGPAAADFLRDAAAAVGMPKVPVIAKLERPEAVRLAAGIIGAFDAIMVARGDLGVEMPLEQVPTVQKQLIAEARAAGKPVITATEMLDSMQKNPRPTRAEVSDVANAICDGTDAVMLSGETAVGQYPVEAVACMARIAEEAEKRLEKVGNGFLTTTALQPRETIEDSMALAACHMAQEVGATAIVTPTISGRTPLLLARYRPAALIVAPAPNPGVMRKMSVMWGIQPVRMAPLEPGDRRMVTAVRDAFIAGAVKAGDRVVVLAGHPIEGEPRLPTVRVVRVGEDGASLEP